MKSMIANPKTVRALLAGATQHRVPMKVQPSNVDSLFPIDAEPGDILISDGIVWVCSRYSQRIPDAIKWRHLKSPFGVPGDVVWFKEGLIRGTCGFVAWRNDPARGPLLDGEFRPWQSCKFWRRDYVASTHMPRWASRLVYTVKRVWVHPIDEIETGDVIATNITDESAGGPDDCPWENYSNMFESPFIKHWDDSYSNPKLPLDQEDPMLYESGPWCWAAELEKVTP